MIRRSSLLLLSLLAACPGGGNDTDTDTDTTAATTGEPSTGEPDTGAPTSSGSTTDATTGSSSGEPDDTTSAPPDDSTTGTDTDVADTDTTGDPVGPCDGLVAPDPANTYLDSASLSKAHPDGKALTLAAYDEDDNSWDIVFFLKDEDVAANTALTIELIGEELLGQASSNQVLGTATLEFVELTPECVTGRVSDAVFDGEVSWVDVQLPGGFVAVRYDND